MPDPDRPRRSRARRLLTGVAIATGTIIVLAGVLEVAARLLLPKEILSFKPIYAHDDAAAYKLKPGLSEYTLGADVVSNSVGHRGPEWSRAKPPGKYRVVLLGDSMAFGFGVEFPSTVGEVLARLLKERAGLDAEVLNFGVPGYNSEQELSVLEDRALAFAPDLVLLLMCGNDHEPQFRVDVDGWLHLPEPVSEEGDTKISNPYAPRPSRWGFLRHSAALLYTKFVWKSYRNREGLPEATGKWLEPVAPGPVPQELEVPVHRPLCRMVELCAQHGVPLVIASIAAPLEYRVLLATFGRDSRVPIIDLNTLFPEVNSWREMADQFGLGWDGHPNAEAHRRWAEGLFGLLSERGLLPR